MLNKNDVLSLRDLALSHLPKVRQLQAEAAKHSRHAADTEAAFSTIKTDYDYLSTSVELQANKLLKLVHRHPEGIVERLIEKAEWDDGLAITEDLAKQDAEDNREVVEQLLLDDAKELCRISGATLPPWLVTAQRANKLAPVSRFSAQDAAILEAIKRLGVDPRCLPEQEAGKPGLRSQVRNFLGEQGMWSGSTVFKKAWDRFLAAHHSD